MNAILNNKPQFGTRGFHRMSTTTTTTTTTTTNYNNGVAPYQNNGNSFAPYNNPAAYNNPAYNNFNSGGNLQLSSQARMMMAMMSMMSAMMSGDFGGLMNMLNGFQGQQMPGAGHIQNPGAVPSGRPGFGLPRNGAAAGARRGAAIGQNVPGIAKGAVQEMKAGQTARGANGSLVKWGKDGNVTIDYKDPNGKAKNVSVKNGMISFDGGKPQKLENTGQLLKLPNGDVVGLGNNPGPKGKNLVRVVVADNAKNIKTEPANATNIYDVDMMRKQQTTMEGGGISINMNSGSYATPWGMSNYMNASISAFTGVPVTRTIFGDQLMKLTGKV